MILIEVSVGVVAVDGSKFAASASDKAIRGYEQVAREIIEEAGRIDAAEDEIHGPARGDELPEQLTTREGRRAWLRDAKQRLERERAERARWVISLALLPAADADSRVLRVPNRAPNRHGPSDPRRAACAATMARWPPSIRPGRRQS